MEPRQYEPGRGRQEPLPSSPPPRAAHRNWRRRAVVGARTGVRGFVARYGWRAYALPLLVVVTVVALLNPAVTHRDASADPVPQTATVTVPAPRSSASPSPSRPAEAVQPATVTGAACRSNTAARLILVSIHLQRAYMCAQATMAHWTPVTTGRVSDGDATPTGTWTILGKQRDRTLVGPGYSQFVHYWMPFWGDFGFHDAPWQKSGYGSPSYVDKGSHGCVHLPEAAMQWLYDWAPVGATVTVES